MVDSNRNPRSIVMGDLISRGWHFRDTERIEGMIAAQSSDSGSCTLESIESELLDFDLRSIGGAFLPGPSALCKVSHLSGPAVLQVCSVRDITRSSIHDTSGNSADRRLLLLKLTDGHSEVKAIEYSHVPLLHEDVIPGTKVLLQTKADIRSGILCLSNKVVTVLGGLVQSLHEEWKMKRKYLLESHHSSKLSRENAQICPPQFEKLQLHPPLRGNTRFSGSNNKGEILPQNVGSSISAQTSSLQNDGSFNDVNLLHNTEKGKERENTPTTRPKVIASVPVQNQLAAQKLLQKATQPNSSGRNFPSQRYRGKGKQEQSAVLTLDEWEKKKVGIDLPLPRDYCSTSLDESLAIELQQKFDLEDIHEQNSSHAADAENIKMSMFNFERPAGVIGRGEFRGRRRGRNSTGRGRVRT